MKAALGRLFTTYLVFWPLCGAIIVLSLWLRNHLNLGSDIAVYLFLAGKILDGGRYYYDFFEWNLPLVFYITAIPVFIARHLALSPIPVFTAFVTLVSITSIALCARVLKGAKLYDDRTLYATLLIAVCTALFLPSPTLSINSIGEKSLFMLAFTLPYFFSCFARKEQLSTFHTIVVGVLAGLGFCLKPQYFILWAGMEIYLASVHRKLFYGWRLMNFIIGGVAAAYLLCLLFIIPEYVQKILPIVPYFYNFKPEDTWYGVFSHAILALFFSHVGFIMALFVVLTPRQLGSSTQETRQVLLYGYLLAGLELAFDNFKGYQRVQLYAFGVLLVFVLVVDFVRHIKDISALRAGVAVSMLLFLLYASPYVQMQDYADELDAPHSFVDFTLPYAQRYANGKALLVLAPDLSLSFPLVTYSGAHWNYKFPFVPAWSFFAYEKMDKSQFTPSELSKFNEARRYFYDTLDEAMTREPPAMIVALEKSTLSSETWDFPQNLLRDKVFAREWTHYKKIAEFTRSVKYGFTFTIGIYTRL